MARAPGLHETGNAERRIRPQLQRIAVVVVQTAENRVDGTQPGHGLQEHAVVADGEIAPFDERESELPGEIGMLEIGLVVRPGRQQHDVRRLARRTGAPASNVSRSAWKNGDSGWTRRARNASGNTRDMIARFSSA